MVVEMRLIFVLLVFACLGCHGRSSEEVYLVKNRYLESTKEVLQVLGQIYGRLAKLTGTVIKGHCNTKHHEADTPFSINNSTNDDEGKVLETLVWIYTSLSDLQERLIEIKMQAKNDGENLRKPAMTMRGLGQVASKYLEPVDIHFDKRTVTQRGGLGKSTSDLIISNKDQLKIAEMLMEDIEVASSMLNKNNRLLLEKLKHFSEDDLYTVIVDVNDGLDIHNFEKSSANKGILTKAGARSLKHAFSYHTDTTEEDKSESHEIDEDLFKPRMGYHVIPSTRSDESFSTSGDIYRRSKTVSTVNPFRNSKHDSIGDTYKPKSFDHLYDPKRAVNPVIPPARAADVRRRSTQWRIKSTSN